jgi:dihydroneopterin aldolase
MKDSDKITLRKMVYWGPVGAAEWEREVGAVVEVDIELHADLGRACKSDALNDTIDYAKLYGLVGEVIAGRHHNLLESLAEEIAGAALGLGDCEKVVVRVRKPHPPVGGPCDNAEVEITRRQASRDNER